MWKAGYKYSWRKMGRVAALHKIELDGDKIVLCGLCSTGSDKAEVKSKSIQCLPRQ